MSTNEQYDFIAIGDTVTDAFISIKQASVYAEHDQDGDGTVDQELCFINGAKIPYESVTIIHAVGNAANAAVAKTALGATAALVLTWVLGTFVLGLQLQIGAPH